jgi:hypothetical protein
MKLSKKQLQQIIQEEIKKELLEENLAGELNKVVVHLTKIIKGISKAAWDNQKAQKKGKYDDIDLSIFEEGIINENLSDALGKIIMQLQKIRQSAGKVAPRAAGSKQAQKTAAEWDQEEKVKDAKCRKLKPAQVYDWTIDACNDPDQAADNEIAELSS